MAGGNNIQVLREARGWSRPELGRRMGTSGQQIERLEKGQRKLSQDWIDRAADALEVDAATILDRGGSRSLSITPDIQVTRSADDTEIVAIQRLDLSYAMGPGTNIDDSYVEGEPVYFGLSFLRALTPSPPSALRIVNGVGDSMFPTIHDREELIVDTHQRVLNMQDRIWAISLFGAGALKRLRAISKSTIKVISDNPDVPDQDVDASDITIAARLVGSIRRH